ncbi:helix-turn-helix domain-containing protein [Patescibacteria group bacterium]|nr:helix-turn-helix domain-containing protein [Patescibacteria group bacterium]
MNDDYVTLQEAARIMRKSEQTLRRLIKKGELQAQRVKTPQGFHYIVSKEGLSEIGPPEQESMFSSSPIQNVVTALEDEENESSPIQVDILTSQTEDVVHVDAVSEPIDRHEAENVVSYEEFKVLHEIIREHHQEKLVLYIILEKLQDELIREKEKTSEFIRKYFDRFQ